MSREPVNLAHLDSGTEVEVAVRGKLVRDLDGAYVVLPNLVRVPLPPETHTAIVIDQRSTE